MRHHPNGSLKNIMAFSAFSNKVSSTKKMFPDLFLEDVYLLFEYFTWSLKPKSKSKKSTRTYTVVIPKPSGLYINILLPYFYTRTLKSSWESTIIEMENESEIHR